MPKKLIVIPSDYSHIDAFAKKAFAILVLSIVALIGAAGTPNASLVDHDGMWCVAPITAERVPGW